MTIYEELPHMTVINFDGEAIYVVPTEQVEAWLAEWNSHGRFTAGTSLIALEV